MHADLGERGEAIVTIPTGDGHEPVRAQRPPHEDNVEHADGKSPIDVRTLRDIGDTGTRATDGLVVQEDFTMSWRQDAIQASEQRALTGSIWTDERRRLTGAEIEADVFDGGTILEVDAQASRPHARHTGTAQFGSN
jgi:hypothetical protein